jgi:NlpC/P60 family putative phage cell wall peptidase
MNAYVIAARSWIGTPYVHQGVMRGAGCDCLGLIRGIWAEVATIGLEPVPAYTADWSEPQGEETLMRAARARLCSKALDDVAAGDVLLFRMRQGAVAKHLGVQAETGPHPTFIHAYQGHGVLENTLSTPWQRRLVGRFAFPELSVSED